MTRRGFLAKRGPGSYSARMKILTVSLTGALLLAACAQHRPHRATQPLRRAPGESAEDFADRKVEMKEHGAEMREIRKQNAEDAKDRAEELAKQQQGAAAQ